MGEFNFNTRQCIRSLRRLGFVLSNKRHGRHDKYLAPLEIANRLQTDQPRFIMVPRHTELHCQPEIIRELRTMGGDELVEAFKHNL